MRRDPFLHQGGTFGSCDGDVFRKQIVEPIMTELVTESIGKDCLGGLAMSFTHPGTQRGDGVLAQRGTALLATFSGATNVGTTAQGNILAAKSD